jgi:UDPglucose--hexose-1-phosphate uridylyltransferase
VKYSTFRKDIVSGDWVLVASSLQKKPNFFGILRRKKFPKKGCPFEDPQKANGSPALFWLPNPKAQGSKREKFSFWFVQAIPNKFPILSPHKTCPMPLPEGPYKKMQGVGFQELVITRDHERSLGFMTTEEILIIVRAYKERYTDLKDEDCVEYILIFHNNGVAAGASVPHPHSQIVALPIIPPDVWRSLDGSARYYHEHRKCAHCVMVKEELKTKKRIIYKNKDFVVIAPYASHVSFEIRLYPLRHSPYFEKIAEAEAKNLADAMKVIFSKMKNAMKDPDYNFFIHTAPVHPGHGEHYHWHIEILPRTNIWAGLELGAGVEIVKVPPEEAAKILRKAKVS